MAQTKRKRRTKHRGNAAGSIESRGRTGRRPTADEQKQLTRQEARERRLNKPPSWNSALMKAAVMAALLFVFTQIGLFGEDTPISQSVLLAGFAMVLYTPLAYATDKFVYTRAQRKRAAAAAANKKR
jgi:drug/metabolite transporter (DMT)-like permease